MLSRSSVWLVYFVDHLIEQLLDRIKAVRCLDLKKPVCEPQVYVGHRRASSVESRRRAVVLPLRGSPIRNRRRK